jgi:ABC-type glycerol-3-phosphate transport system permease component
MSAPGKKWRSDLLAFLVLGPFLAAVIFPMIWLIYTSFKSDAEIFLDPFAMPRLSHLHFENYRRAWVEAHFSSYFWSSVLVTGLTVLFTVAIGSMAAYALARFRFAGKTALKALFLAGLMVPLQLSVVPLFFQMRSMGLLNSLTGLVIIYTATGLPFAIFILTAFFMSLPQSLYEAAVLDGCTEWRAFRSIMLPLARPGLITVAIFSGLGAWNEYFLAFLFLSGPSDSGLGTLPLGLARISITSQFRSDWGMAFAALVLVTIPALIFYTLLQKHIIKGIASGAVKG